ncbi:MAG: DUF748 domain-containing protein [Burkholderiaceae bacterium]|nr:DUF748 domain-containing protein [Burkholderiaceae bacterium]
MNIAFLQNHRWAKRLAWMAAALLALWAIGWLAVGPLLRSQGEKIATEKLGRQVSIGRVDFRPWSLELSVHDLAIAAADGVTPQVQIKRLYIDAELQSLLRFAPVIDALEIDEPTLRLTQLSPGRHDLDDVLKRFESPAEPAPDPQAPVPKFAIYNIVVQGGSVDFQDKTVGRSHTLRDLTLRVPFLSSLQSYREVKVLPHLAFKLNGSAFDSMAEATPFNDSQKADATVRFSGFDLAPYLGYLPASLPVRLESGVLDADLRFSFEHTSSAVVKLSGHLQAHKVRVADTAKNKLLSLEALKVDIADLQPLARSVRVNSVELQAPHVTARRDRSGRINWAPPSPPKGAMPAGTDQPKTATPWQVVVARVAVRGAQVDWLDEQLPVAAHLALRDLALDASAIALPLTHPLRFAGETKISANDAQQGLGRIVFEGDATEQQAKVAVSVQTLPLALAAPYAAQFATPRLGGTLDAEFGLAWNAPALAAHIGKLTLSGVELNCPAKAECTSAAAAGLSMRSQDALAELKKLQIENTRIDLARRSVTLGRIALTQPRVLVERGLDGRWMFERWLLAPPAAASAKKSAPAPGSNPSWTVLLADVALDGGAVAFQDQQPAGKVDFLLSALQLRLKDFAPLSASAKPSALTVSARMGAGRADPGRFEYDGTLGLAPLAAQGKVLASQLPLHVFEPYMANGLNVDIRRADGSFKGQVRYAQMPAGAEVAVQGDAALDDVRVRKAAEGVPSNGLKTLDSAEDLLHWKSLGVRGIQVAMVPGKPMTVDIAQTSLSDFFARVIVQENGRINLQDLTKAPAAAKTAGVSVAAVAAPTEKASAPARVADALAPVIRVGPITMTKGKVYFSDYFIKPNYSAHLSDLGGRLSAFSSVAQVAGGAPVMADLELRGRAEGTASLEITGKLNPLAQPLALDIQGHMHDLELPPLSPYTIKYAGHGIERGKLSMDVTYQVLPNGQLTASNKLVLHQLTFGNPVEGAPASLPVRLAVALLADRNGVIDVDLPISGSLNDPQFRIGPVIFKVIGNLIMKAVTAPFSLLAGAFGGSNELSSVVFAPGSAELNDSARKGLDKVAKAMIERPALKMTVIGQASAEVEAPAWRQQRLQQAVLAQKRRTAVRAGTAAEEVKAVSAEEYPGLLKEVYRRADVTKQRNLIGMAKELPVAEMEALLLASVVIPADAMRDLAVARGVAVRDYLASRELPLDRLFLGAAKNVPHDSAWKPHAELALGTH